MERDSFIFYRSFYEASTYLSNEDKGKLFDMICQYGLYGKEIEGDGPSKGMFMLIKPQLDANNKRYENGCKGGEYGKLGGRPKKDWENSQKPQTNPTQTPNDNVNVNVNDNVNEKDISKFEEFWNRYPKKVKKKDAKRKFNSLSQIKQQLAIDALEKFKQTDQRKRGYIPDPTTYINQERREDEIETKEEKPNTLVYH